MRAAALLAVVTLGCGQEIRVADAGATLPATSVVFSEIAFESAASSSDEFVELYNPQSEPWALSGCQLQYDGASSGVTWLVFHTFPAEGGPQIGARGFFLIAGSGYSGPAVDAPRSSSAFTMGGDGSLRLLCGEEVLDQVAWGGGDAPEGSNAPGADGDQSLERKATAGSTTATLGPGGAEANAGNGQDTGDNAQDFVIRDLRQPQNASSPPEP